MNHIIDRDPVAMEQFCKKLADFCDTMEQKSCLLRKKCQEADYAMQDQNGKLVVNRLNSMADDISAQVAQARVLVGRISRSAALLTENKEETAVIYANIHRLEDFQEYWESIPAPLDAAISDRDTDISDTRTALNSAIAEAEEIRNKAQKRLQQAQDDPAPYEQAYEMACCQLKRLEAQRERFDEVSARCTAAQDQALEAIKKLSAKGSDWLDRYTQLLQEAKLAIYEDALSGSASFLAPDGGYIGARELTPEEYADIQAKTGWTDNQLQKCQIRPDGSLWYKTNNCRRDMERYKGVLFQRDTVTINGVRVEGIFPQFNSLYQPETSLPESLWSKPREAHFAWCRTQLKIAVENNPALAAHFSAEERKLIAAEERLPGYSWHHHQQPGKMQLVRTTQVRKALHKVGHTGGYALWCAASAE